MVLHNYEMTLDTFGWSQGVHNTQAPLYTQEGLTLMVSMLTTSTKMFDRKYDIALVFNRGGGGNQNLRGRNMLSGYNYLHGKNYIILWSDCENWGGKCPSRPPCSASPVLHC